MNHTGRSNFEKLREADQIPTSAIGDHNDIFETYGIIRTHHIAVSTSQAQQAIAQETLRIVREYRSTGQPPNVIADT